MIRRSGSSLVEVLVAIFVMGLGLIALLTLFPIGMLRMAQAISDAKCSTAASNAHVLSIVQNVRNDPSAVTLGTQDLFANPYPETPAFLKKADPFGESYAILVDPIGYNSVGGSAQSWVANVAGLLRRRPVSFAATAVPIYKSFTLADDTKFENSTAGITTPGTPYKLTAATNVFRDTRYSWAYLLRRPQTSDLNIVDCSIVVFDKRNTSMSGGSLPEYVYQNTSYFDTARNAITIDYTGNVPPPIYPGNWLLDATIINSGTAGTQHAYFYRVVSVEEIVAGARTYVRYEVANPLRGFTGAQIADPTNASNSVYQGTVIVLDGIAEVFEKGPGRLP